MNFTFLLALGLLNATCMNVVSHTTALAGGTLLVGILSIASSYAQNIERAVIGGVPDTVQFWIAGEKSWRVRTYAADHDIHPHSLGDLVKMKEKPAEFARAHILKNYGDILESLVVLEFKNISDTNEVRRVLEAQKIKGRLEIAKAGFVFLNPDGGRYQGKSTPR